MEVKPSKGLSVRVNAQREAVFGEESVTVNRVSLGGEASRMGVLTGTTLAGFCEVEMAGLDGKRHWYPIDDISGVNGEKVVEDEVQVEEADDDDSEG